MSKTFLSSGAEQLEGVSGLPEDICIQDYALTGSVPAQLQHPRVAQSPEPMHLMCLRPREELQALGVFFHH